MAIATLALLLSVVAAFADIIGGAVTVLPRLNSRKVACLTALGTGFLIGATLLDRLPESMHELSSRAPLYIVLGYLAMLMIDRHSLHHGRRYTDLSGQRPSKGDTHECSCHTSARMVTRRSGLIMFLGMFVHAFMDGVIIAGGLLINRTTGILMFLAIMLHKLPEGFSIATVRLAAGEARSTAFTSSAGLALSTILGAVVTLFAGAVDAGIVQVVMALATGTFLFITTSALVPAVQDSGEPRALYLVIAGVILFYLSLSVVHGGVGLS